MKITDIKWDTEDDGEVVEVELPEEVVIDDNIEEEDIADYLSDIYGWCVESFSIDRSVDLGTFTVDVELQENGKYDVYIAHEGSSGEHYTDVTADEIGRYVAEDIEAITKECHH